MACSGCQERREIARRLIQKAQERDRDGMRNEGRRFITSVKDDTKRILMPRSWYTPLRPRD